MDSYKVLARKYRPKTFDDFVGQDLFVKILKNAFAINRIAHSFLFTGIRGVGKTTAARIISACLNCVGETGKGGPTINPCGLCNSCRSIANGNHVDVLEIDAASKTGVGDIREIIDSVKYKPASARYKVFIIDEVHMLSTNAFNALLKTLEEPPAHTKFIFATTEIHKIPVTVVSRCQRYDLRRVSPKTLIEYLRQILQKEEKHFEDEALSLVARASEGSVRDALSLLDQIILQSDERANVEDIQALLGLSDRHKLLDLFEFILEGEIKKSLDTLRQLFTNGADPILILKEISEITHWVTSLKVAPDLSKDPLFTSTEKEKGTYLARKTPLSVLIRMWQIISKTLEEENIHTNQLAHVEMSIIRLTTISILPTPAEIIKEYKNLNSNQPYSELKKKDQIIQKLKTKSDDEIHLHEESHFGESFPTENRDHRKSWSHVKGEDGNLDLSKVDKKRAESSTNSGNIEELEKVVQENEILDLLRGAKEIPLVVEIENFVSFVSCKMGQLKLQLKEKHPPNLVSRLSMTLKEITDIHWTIEIEEGSRGKTVKEKLMENKKVIRQSLEKNDIVKSVLDTFPGADVIFDDKDNNV